MSLVTLHLSFSDGKPIVFFSYASKNFSLVIVVLLFLKAKITSFANVSKSAPSTVNVAISSSYFYFLNAPFILSSYTI